MPANSRGEPGVNYMKNLFFYGTLRHIPLLETVIARAGGFLDVAQAVLPGHAVLAAKDGPFPVLVSETSAEAQGIVVRDLSDEDIARLNFYEAGFDYDLQRLTLANGEAAEVYVPTPGVWKTDGPWNFDAWVRDWADMSVAAAHEVMDGFGTLTPNDIAARFPRCLLYTSPSPRDRG